MRDTATLERRARWAQIALVAVMVTDLIGVWSAMRQIDLLDRAIAGEDIALSAFESDDNRQLVVGLLQFVALLAAVVLFLRWFHRAYVDLPRLGSVRRFKTGWAIGGWFVPILALWRPKQLANDLWRGTEPVPGTPPPASPAARWSWLLNVWWAGFVVLGFLEQRAALAYWNAPIVAEAGPQATAGVTADAEQAQSAARLDLLSSIVDLPVATLAILVVSALTARHVARPRAAAEPAVP
jgi:hypothetical protein